MKKLFPGAVLGLTAVILTSGMTGLQTNGYVRKPYRNHGTSEPLFEINPYWCWVTAGQGYGCIPIPSDPPKVVRPDVPAGCCSDTCIGPCQ